MARRPVLSILRNIRKRFINSARIPKNGKKSRILEDEKVLKKIHVHWIVYVPALLGAAVSTSLFGLSLVYSSEIADIIGTSQQVITISIFLVFAFIFTAIINNLIFTWYSFYILTDHRLIHIRLEKNFTYQAEEYFLIRIKYIDSRRLGLFSMLLNYGEVDIDLDIGNGGYDCVMKRVPNPTQVTTLINNLIEKKYGSIQSNQLGSTY